MRALRSCCTGITLLAMGALSGSAGAQAPRACTDAPLMLQVLGSGGPFAGGGKRASSSYLVWHNGRAVAMVDAGGGAFVRFGEAGAQLADLSVLAISHLHPDHVADLPALVWVSEGVRREPLVVYGPSGSGDFPAMDAFVRRLFDSTGAYPILRGTLGQPGGRGAKLDVRTVSATVGSASTLAELGPLTLRAIGVPHGGVPSLAYRLQVGDRSVAFGSDQNGTDPAFVDFARGVDVLVMHLSLSKAAPDPMAQLHARPATVGQVAKAANPRRLVLSHVIEAPPAYASPQFFGGSDLAQALAEVRGAFTGPVDVATDLQCIPIR